MTTKSVAWFRRAVVALVANSLLIAVPAAHAAADDGGGAAGAPPPAVGTDATFIDEGGTSATLTGDIGVLDERPTAERRLLVTGDSISQGSSGDYTWRYRLWKKLQTTAPEKVSFVGTTTKIYNNLAATFDSSSYAVPFRGSAHAARWGALLSDQVELVSQQVAATNANTLVTMLGINDLVWGGSSPTAVVSNMREYIRRARVAAPGIDIVICEVLSRFDFYTNQLMQGAESADIASRFADLASELDTTTERVVVANTLTGWNPKLHTWDGTHPNATGETLIAQRVSGALSKMGIGTSTPNTFETTAWAVNAGAPTVSAGIEKATVSWNRASTGATAMYLEYKLADVGGPYQRLPYGIADQDSWVMDPLVAGGTYRWRTVPVKGFMTGVAGPSVQRLIAGLTPAVPKNVRAEQLGWGSNGFARGNLDWDSATNAQGYLLAVSTMPVPTGGYYELPYPVSDATDWTTDMLFRGRYYRFKVRSSRGFLASAWVNSNPIRTKGMPQGDPYWHYALGDSYSSGNGRYPFPGDYEDMSCVRTRDGWAGQVASGYTLYHVIAACSGAKAFSVDAGDHDVRHDQVEAWLVPENLKPGPTLITVTAGGNDLGFREIIENCILASTCNGADNFESYTNLIDHFAPSLGLLYDEIRSRAPYADIAVGGYPAPLDPYGSNGGCVWASDTTLAERQFIYDLTKHLNLRISEEARDSKVWGSFGTRVMNRFAGHDACDSNSWIVGPDVQWFRNYFHPDPTGHQKMAEVMNETLLAHSGEQ